MMKRLVYLVLFVIIVQPAFSQRLVLPGDHPDPSVVKIGDTYWASATTSNWFPAFPLLRSDDLVNWTQQGYVFTKKPDWADYYFWAPEISYDKGKVYIYYSAHKKNGNLCIGVASADKPEGPYTDHGPLVCQAAGSIDGFPMRDKDGKLYLVWKEDNNSVGKPTPIWASEMNEARTALIGEKKELFRNDRPWENNLVEGVSIIERGDYLYAVYAGAGCCGTGCNYAVGVARSKSLLGPWEKDPANPILGNEGDWMCPGHGTALIQRGKDYFLYHAYSKTSHAFTGRQGLLQEFTFTKDGWMRFVKQEGSDKNSSVKSFTDNFNGNLLETWQWSIFEDVKAANKNGQLVLQALPTAAGAYLGQLAYTGDYDATVKVLPGKNNAAAGLAAIGDDKNIVSLLATGNSLLLTVLKDGKDSSAERISLKDGRSLTLKMQFRNGLVTFLYSPDGKNYRQVNKKPVNGKFLPPWDRAVRAGVVAKGARGKVGVFDDFTIVPVSDR